ncbi:hypothetical protein R1sor_015872 [Riccia sorocarpa]|uniref:mitogen-activated protein kinase kinase kinase n=1 Tax=Riccia sorocarpa TaxID=122646 RepID=A0ABD3HDT0_9MARC
MVTRIRLLGQTGNILRSKVSSPLTTKLERDLYGHLHTMTERLKEAKTLFFSLSGPDFCSETTIDKITQLRVVILLALWAINNFFRLDEVDPEFTFQDLQMASQPQIPTPSVGEMQKVTDAIQQPWKLVREVGRGGFGTVWLAKDSADKYFALKELYYDPPPNACGISFERDYIEKLQQLEHKHIVRYLGCEKGDGVLRIFMELAGKQSLRAYYKTQYLKLGQVKEFTRQILDALVYVHSKKIVHRDVKCDNIMVDDSDNCKLVDFGVAKQLLCSGDQAKTQVGSTRWMAPEIIRPFRRPDGKMITGYSRPADIWSLGCTVLEMCTGEIPFQDVTNNAAVVFKIGNLKTSPNIPASLPEQMKDFLRQCFKKDPTERPTAQILLQHPFVAGIPDLAEMWEAEHTRLQELRPSTLKEHAEAVVAKHRLQFARRKDLTVSV